MLFPALLLAACAGDGARVGSAQQLDTLDMKGSDAGGSVTAIDATESRGSDAIEAEDTHPQVDVAADVSNDLADAALQGDALDPEDGDVAADAADADIAGAGEDSGAGLPDDECPAVCRSIDDVRVMIVRPRDLQVRATTADHLEFTVDVKVCCYAFAYPFYMLTVEPGAHVTAGDEIGISGVSVYPGAHTISAELRTVDGAPLEEDGGRDSVRVLVLRTGCDGDGDCDDYEPCTLEECYGHCWYTADLTAGEQCVDFNKTYGDLLGVSKSCFDNHMCDWNGSLYPPNSCKEVQCQPWTDPPHCVVRFVGQYSNCKADECTADGVCDGGRCVVRSELDCDDGDPCTADSCDPARGCVNVPGRCP